MFDRLDETSQEIFSKYKTALIYIGIDFSREDVQEPIVDCDSGLESAFQATITYWLWKQDLQEQFAYPNAFLIKAIQENWQPFNWQDHYLHHPHFKSRCQLWWEEAQQVWGEDLRNELVADVRENQWGKEYIFFCSGQTITLELARIWGWERLLNYVKLSLD